MASAYETMILPRGTLLFRGINSVKDLVSDYAGILEEEDIQVFCLNQNYNVFFYPYPFIADTVAKYNIIGFFVTTRDLTILKLVSPSKFSRNDRYQNKGGIISCDKVPEACGAEGREYDPCIDFSKVPKDVSGMVAIAGQDARTLDRSKSLYRSYFNKYFTTFKDSKNRVGVPEIILHPRLDKKERTEQILDFEPWYKKNSKDLNFQHLKLLTNTKLEIETTIDDLLSDEGADMQGTIYHAKINKQTGFFQIVELSDTFAVAEQAFSVKYPEAQLQRKHMMKVLPDLSTITPERTLLPGLISFNREYILGWTGRYEASVPIFRHDKLDLIRKYMDMKSYTNVFINSKWYGLGVINTDGSISRENRYVGFSDEEYNNVTVIEDSFFGPKPLPQLNGLLNTIYRKSIEGKTQTRKRKRVI